MQDTDPQIEFNEKYITSTEICKRLQIERATVTTARKRDFLPKPIIVPGLGTFIWKREDIEPILAAWQLTLNSRRRKSNAEKG